MLFARGLGTSLIFSRCVAIEQELLANDSHQYVCAYVITALYALHCSCPGSSVQCNTCTCSLFVDVQKIICHGNNSVCCFASSDFLCFVPCSLCIYWMRRNHNTFSCFCTVVQLDKFVLLSRSDGSGKQWRSPPVERRQAGKTSYDYVHVLCHRACTGTRTLLARDVGTR